MNPSSTNRRRIVVGVLAAIAASAAVANSAEARGCDPSRQCCQPKGLAGGGGGFINNHNETAL